MNTTTQPGEVTQPSQRAQAAPPLSPALVREVTEKVYALWLRDLQMERERLGSQRKRRSPQLWK